MSRKFIELTLVSDDRATEYFNVDNILRFGTNASGSFIHMIDDYSGEDHRRPGPCFVKQDPAAILALINGDEQSLAKAQGKYLVEKGPFDGYYVIHPESNRPVCDCTSKFIAESITNALNRDPITCTHCGKPFTAGDSCGRCGPLRTKSCDFCEQMTSEVMSRDAFIRQLMSAAIETIEAYDEWLANPNEDDDIRLCAAIEAVRRLQAGDSPRVVDKQAAPDVALLDSITRLMSLMKLKENWGHLFGSDRAFSKPSDCPNETLRLVIEAYEDLAGQLEKARAAVEGKSC